MEIDTVPEPRVRLVNTAPVQEKQDYVLYWMTAFRRTQWNFSLDRAVDWAASLRRPLIVFEPLSCSYRWASDRFHQFVLDGMEDNGRALAGHPAAYLPYVEPHPGAGRYLLETLASRACVVVTDDYPAFFLPGMVRAAGKRLDVRLEAVDSNGLLPLASASRAYPTAASFRRHLQGKLAEHLKAFPREHPFEGVQLPQMQSPLSEIRRQWPSASGPLRDMPINHAVPPVALRGGRTSGSGLLGVFVSENLGNYASARNHPDGEATSGLSPYLHFGHISAHEVFAAVAEKERWSFDKHRRTTNGKRLGWWKMSESAEEFLDQLVTWR
jgi:deoxyribodipyrimidine photo-lyase